MNADNSIANRSLVAVVVTYNRLNQLQVTLQRLKDFSADELTAIVVVDNASTDGTGDWLDGQTDARLHIHLHTENGGGAAGFYTGMREAVARFDPDWLVVMDDDARPYRDALTAFHALPEDKWDAMAAAVYFPGGDICEMNRPSRNPFWHWQEFWRTVRGGRGGFHLRPECYDGPAVEIDVTSFVGFFISRRAISVAGYPDKRLFIYGDDGLYTLGIRKAGGRIGFEPGIRFEHDLTTFDGQRGRFRPLWKAYYYHRNLLMLYRLAAGWLFWPTLLVILPKWLAKRRDHPGDEVVFDRLIRRAVRDGLRNDTSLTHPDIVEMAEAPVTD